MTIYLIRHGKTEANEKHLYCGSTDLIQAKKNCGAYIMTFKVSVSLPAV